MMGRPSSRAVTMFASKKVAPVQTQLPALRVPLPQHRLLSSTFRCG